MRIVKELSTNDRLTRKLTDDQKESIRERLNRRLAERKVKKESVEDLLKKENVFQIKKEVKVTLADRDLILEAGDIIEVIPKVTEADDEKKKKKDKEKNGDGEKEEKK